MTMARDFDDAARYLLDAGGVILVMLFFPGGLGALAYQVRACCKRAGVQNSRGCPAGIVKPFTVVDEVETVTVTVAAVGTGASSTTFKTSVPVPKSILSPSASV